MRYVVLSSRPESPYADTPTSYEYPARYRRYFAPLDSGEPMLAIIYEPHSGGRGRMAYVGWAALRERPTPSVRTLADGSPLWEVKYVGRVEEFPNPVPRDQAGEPLEGWLRAIAREHRSIRSSGASVRELPEAEAGLILTLGHAGQLESSLEYPMAGDVRDAPELVADRGRRLLTAIERDARFRRAVMSAYEFRCAISGFGTGALAEGRATRLIDAAHIRPVSQHGPDAVPNGLALTPTLHRLFDEGLFTIALRDDSPVIVTSPLLQPTMIQSPDGRFRLPLVTGMAVSIPTEATLRPSSSQLRFHQHSVFKGSPSLVP